MAKKSRTKGNRAEREVKALFESYGYEAIRTGSGICPDIKNDVIAYINGYALVVEVKYYKDSFAMDYKKLMLNDIVIKDELVTMLANTFFRLVKYKDVSLEELSSFEASESMKFFDKQLYTTIDRYDINNKPTIPVIVKRRNRSEWLITLSYNDLVDIINNK